MEHFHACNILPDDNKVAAVLQADISGVYPGGASSSYYEHGKLI